MDDKFGMTVQKVQLLRILPVKLKAFEVTRMYICNTTMLYIVSLNVHCIHLLIGNIRVQNKCVDVNTLV